MPEREVSGMRDLLYSQWHRTESLSRFIPPSIALELHMIDVDSIELDGLAVDASTTVWIEALKDTAETAAIIETTTSKAKCYRITAGLARAARKPGYCVCYIPNDKRDDIDYFVVRQIAPVADDPVWMFPCEYARFLVSLRPALHDRLLALECA